MGRIPDAIRDRVLIAADFTCCVCGEFRFYCDVHHVKPVSEGGTSDIRNLVTLCPNDHRAAHRKRLTPAQLRKLWKRHTENVRVAVAAKDTLRTAQEVVITAFMHEHFIEKPYDREKYVAQPNDSLYMIAWDLLRIGVITDPTDNLPVLVNNADLPRLCAIEVVSDPFRLMFLEEQQRHDKTKALQHYALIRLDIADVVGTLPRKARSRTDFRRRVIELLDGANKGRHR
jgi:hypothetical protein